MCDGPETVISSSSWAYTCTFDTPFESMTPFAALSAYWPSPLAVLRTLKSDVIVGIASETLSALDATGEPWRTNGTRALIQVRA